MVRLGLSTCFFGANTVEEWRAAKDAGFTDVEISLNCPLDEYLQKGEVLASRIKEAGLRVWSVHIPYIRDFDLTCPDKAQWADIEMRYRALIDAGHAWGAEVINTHASSEPFDQGEREARMARGKAVYQLLGEYAAARGMRIAVEVLPRRCMGNTAADCMALSDGVVSFINFDVNHLLWESHADFIRDAGSRVITTHISDYDFEDERHWIPGDGKIDWKELYTLLQAAGYTGPYLFELGEMVSGEKITPAALVARFRALIGE